MNENDVTMPYSSTDVKKLRGSLHIEHTLARHGAELLRSYLKEGGFVSALGALTGNQAIQQVRAGLNSIYVSGWQVAADANGAGQMYPDQSLYPVDSVPKLVESINNALLRCDQIESIEGKNTQTWLQPIVADAEAGFGGPLNVYELAKAMIASGAAGIHLEDQLSSAKKCGHLGGKVLVPVNQHIRSLIAARLAADVMNVPTVIIARTDALAARLLTSDIDPIDKKFITEEKRTSEGYYHITGGLDMAIERGLAYAPYADLIWCETSNPSLNVAQRFADGIRSKYPEKPLAFNCSPSFRWSLDLSSDELLNFQQQLANMGYKYQFITLAGFHTLNYSMFELARTYRDNGMFAYSELQEREFTSQQEGYTAVRHQHEVGVNYYDYITKIINSESETVGMQGSTEEAQFDSQD